MEGKGGRKRVRAGFMRPELHVHVLRLLHGTVDVGMLLNAMQVAEISPPQPTSVFLTPSKVRRVSTAHLDPHACQRRFMMWLWRDCDGC